jgi:hypothetical protein
MAKVTLNANSVLVKENAQIAKGKKEPHVFSVITAKYVRSVMIAAEKVFLYAISAMIPKRAICAVEQKLVIYVMVNAFIIE